MYIRETLEIKLIIKYIMFLILKGYMFEAIVLYTVA